MKRRWNILMWVGFLVVLSAPLTYATVFARFPITRDFPWATLLIFGAGLFLIGRGLRGAYREPQVYRGKIAGTILMSLSLALVAFFGFEIFYVARQLPPSEGAPRVGQKAPDFTLLDEDGNQVTLGELLDDAGNGPEPANGVVLIFYRGFW